jgi:hypothetical protein
LGPDRKKIGGKVTLDNIHANLRPFHVALKG